MSSENLSTEQLLEIVDKKSAVSKPFLDNSNLKNFIKDYQIETGKEAIPAYVIYYNYCKKWTLQGKKLSKIGFFRKFNQLFTQKRSKSTRSYLLKKGIFNLDKESLDDAKRFDEKYRRKIKEKRAKTNTGV